MRKILLLLTLCCALIACKKNEVDFNYSPLEPRAGQPVVFGNQSTTGEEWEWSFGDGSTSTLKAPTHTFRNPGTYIVMLKVDNKKSWTVSKQLTVYDTIPTFVCEDSVFYIYQDYTFTANIYNPYNYDVEYLWSCSSDAEVTDDNMTGEVLHLFFTRALNNAKIGLQIIFNGDTTYVEKSFVIEDKPTNSIVIRTADADYRQRIFGSRSENAKVDATAKALLDAAQDTAQTYNGKEFTLTTLSSTFDGIEGFHIANRKIYYRANGLWVANIDGANPVQIDTAACPAMTLDTYDNRIYWANENGVWFMPFVGSDNNKFVTVPTQLNTLTNVTNMASDYDLK